MVAYSFKKRFAEPILENSKLQTIRAGRKRHARPGEELQLYVGMRTKHCRLIGRRRCVAVEPVRLSFSRKMGPLVFTVGAQVLGCDEMEEFARRDGFGRDGGMAIFDMTEFWLAEHGGKEDVLEFEGVCVRWMPDPEITFTVTPPWNGLYGVVTLVRASANPNG